MMNEPLCFEPSRFQYVYWVFVLLGMFFGSCLTVIIQKYGRAMLYLLKGGR